MDGERSYVMNQAKFDNTKRMIIERKQNGGGDKSSSKSIQYIEESNVYANNPASKQGSMEGLGQIKTPKPEI
jgi:hypothetical protein